VLQSIRPYRAALEWIFHQDMRSVQIVDIAGHWHGHFRGDVADDDESIQRQVMSFFHLADAAGVGSFVLGRKGHPSRLDIDKAALGQLVAEASLETPSTDEDEEPAASEESPVDKPPPPPARDVKGESPIVPDAPTPAKVFISHGKNMSIVDQIKTMLDLGDLDYEVAVDEEETAIPVPEKVFNAMRRCTSAVICVTADEGNKQEDGSFRVNENVLIEIGAAFVLYDKRVVLVWDRRIPVPSNLQGLYRSEFEGDDLSWGAGMKLMKAVSKFKKAS
jgi:hypothetical protein